MFGSFLSGLGWLAPPKSTREREPTLLWNHYTHQPRKRRTNGACLCNGLVSSTDRHQSELGYSCRMKAGDTVRLIGIPPNLPEYADLQTRTLFEKCLGQTFVILGLEHVEGLPYPLARLDVGHAIGE